MTCVNLRNADHLVSACRRRVDVVARLGWLSLLTYPGSVIADTAESEQFAVLFMLFLAGFTAVMLLSAIPRNVRPDVVTPSMLKAYARSKGLVAEVVHNGAMTVRRLRGVWRRLRRRDPSEGQPGLGEVVFRGTLDGLPFVIDEVWHNRWLGNAWQRRLYLRMAVELPETPPGLEVRPGGIWARLSGKAGLRRVGMTAHEGVLVARFSRRPVDQARERMFLNHERRRLLESAQATFGGVHVHDGRLYLVHPRFQVNVPVLDRMYHGIAELAAEIGRSA